MTTLPRSLKISIDGDLDISSKSLALTTTLIEYVGQRLTQRLRFFLGEWFLDVRLGIPYFRYAFVKKPDTALLASIFARIIRGTAGVSALRSISVKVDSKTRIGTVEFEAVLSSGEVLSNSSLDIPFGSLG
jgi:hypothetical protein